MPWSGVPASVAPGGSFTATWTAPSAAVKSRGASFSPFWSICPGTPGTLSLSRLATIPSSSSVRVTFTATTSNICYNPRALISVVYFDENESQSDPVAFNVVTPRVIAPSATLRGVSDVLVNGSLFPSISLSGGDYDSVTHSWSAVGGTISGTSNSATFRAAGTHNFSASITWSGTFKKSGASDVTISRTQRFRVTAQPVVLPAASLSGVEDLKVNDSFTANISLLGGSYNTVSNRWSVTPAAAGTLRTNTYSATFNAGDTEYSRVTLTWTGVFGRPGATTRQTSRSATFAITKPVYTVNGPDQIETGQTGTFSVTSSESLAAASVEWSTDPPGIGTINSSGTACTIEPDDLTVVRGLASDLPFNVVATITVGGETFTARKQSKVVPDPPNAVASAVTVENVSSVEQGQSLNPTVSLTGGTYDEIDYNWTVVPSDAGEFDDPAAAEPEFTAARSTQTRNNVKLCAELTFRGTGTKAYNGTSQKTSDHCASFRITADRAVAPVIRIAGLRSVIQGELLPVAAVRVEEGIYDTLTYQWTVESDDPEVTAADIGTFGNPTRQSTGFRGASTTRNIEARMVVTVTATRVAGEVTTTATATTKADFTLLVERPDATIDTAVIVGETIVARGGTVEFDVEVSGDTFYDELEYAWTVIRPPTNPSGSGSGVFKDGAVSPALFQATLKGRAKIKCVLTAKGTGSNATDGSTYEKTLPLFDITIIDTDTVDDLVTGTWKEIPEPGQQYRLDEATLPVIAEYREGGGAWKFGTEIRDRANGKSRTFWNERTAGNQETVPDPSFIDRKIRDMAFIQNRLVFLTTDSVVASFAGLHGSFWGSSVQGVLPSDPIDLNIGNAVAANCLAAQGPNLWILTPEQQYALYPADTSGGWTPQNMRIDKMAQIALKLDLRIWSDGSIVCVGRPGGLLLDLSLDLRGIQPVDISARCPNLLSWPRLTKKQVEEGKYQWKRDESEEICRCYVHGAQTQVVLQRSTIIDNTTGLRPTRLLITRQVGDTFCWSYTQFEVLGDEDDPEEKQPNKWRFDYEIMSVTQHQENLYMLLKDKDGQVHLESLDLGDEDNPVCCDHRGCADSECVFFSCIRFSAPVFFVNSLGELTPARHTNFQVKNYVIHFKPKPDCDDGIFWFKVISTPNGRDSQVTYFNNRKFGFSQEDFLESPLPEFDSIQIPCEYESKYFAVCVVSSSPIGFEILGGEFNCYVSGPEARRNRINP